MKKVFLTICCMMTFLCSSQAQHLNFMGIPIDGSIEAFETKLKTKGFEKSKDFGEINTRYERWYDGRFAGEDVLLSVHCTKTSLVYCTNVLLFFETLDYAKKKWEYYVSVIEEKYKDKIVNKRIQGTDNIRYEMEAGDIDVFYEKSDFKSYKYKLYLMYFDRKNTSINNEMNKEDI